MHANTSVPLLEAEKISKTFFKPSKTTLLKGIDLRLMPGESIAIVGRSGEGKSTLLQILGTLENFCEGSLYLCGEKVGSHNKVRLRNKEIGFVFQSFHLMEDYTVLENVLMPARIAREPIHKGSASFERAQELLKKVGLSQRADYATNLLSGGEKQRVALARAMCNDPSLLLADEPSGNLDKETASLIHEILLNFGSQKGKGVLLVTHHLELASMCSHRYDLREGLLFHSSSL